MSKTAILLSEAKQLLENLGAAVESDFPEDHLTKHVRASLDAAWIFLEDTEDEI